MRENPRGPLAIADAQIKEETGRDSDDWYFLLDAWGARGQTHRAIVDHLQTIYGLGDDWANTMAVRYEFARGLQHQLSIPADLIAATLFKPQARLKLEEMDAAQQRHVIATIDAPPDAQQRRARIAAIVQQLLETE